MIFSDSLTVYLDKTTMTSFDDYTVEFVDCTIGYTPDYTTNQDTKYTIDCLRKLFEECCFTYRYLNLCRTTVTKSVKEVPIPNHYINEICSHLFSQGCGPISLNGSIIGHSLYNIYPYEFKDGKHLLYLRIEEKTTRLSVSLMIEIGITSDSSFECEPKFCVKERSVRLKLLFPKNFNWDVIQKTITSYFTKPLYKFLRLDMILRNIVSSNSFSAKVIEEFLNNDQVTKNDLFLI